MTAPRNGPALPPALVLKVDVDTYQGTLEGVPRLLELFAREGVRASFLFSVGPDRTGLAVKRVLRRGFIKKVLRASPAASYGLRTLLYGTLLPAPDIGARKEAVSRMRQAEAAGHECGLHAWDHVGWHDGLVSWGGERVAEVLRLAHDRFAGIFGRRATVCGAPGWTATALSAQIQEAMGVRVSSDTRGGAPFHPLRPDGSASAAVELPSTLPTLDELLALDEFGASAAAREGTTSHLLALLRGSRATAIHSIHTEIEGGRALYPLFERQLRAFREAGIRFQTLGEAAAEARAAGGLPHRALSFTTVKGRALPVATGWA